MAAVVTSNEMPSLEALSRDRMTKRFHALLTGDRGRDFEDKVLLTNLARLVDRSVVRYEEASSYLDQWIETQHSGNFSALFRGTSALEDCITLVHRSNNYVGVLHERNLGAGVLPTEADIESVKEMRDAIHHLEDRVLGKRKPHVERGDQTFPSFGQTAVELGKHRLEYTTLASNITALHEYVGAVV